MKNTRFSPRFAALALAIAAMTGTLVQAQPAAPELKAIPLIARSSAPAQPPAPAPSDRNAKILAQVSACLAANSCQVILIDKDKPLVDLRKTASRDMGYDVWEQFVSAP